MKFFGILFMCLYSLNSYAESCKLNPGNSKLAQWGWDKNCGVNCEKVAAIENLDSTVVAIKAQIEALQARLDSVQAQQSEIFNTFEKKVKVQIMGRQTVDQERLISKSDEFIKKVEAIVFKKFPRANLQVEKNKSVGVLFSFHVSAEELAVGSEEFSSIKLKELQKEVSKLFKAEEDTAVYVYSSTPGSIDACNL